MSKKYNTTDLDPATSFERHIFHRDQFAHYLRWTHILKEVKIGERIIDFGCGKGNLLEVLYRNRFRPGRYVGIDIREKTIKKATEQFKMVPEAKFITGDLIADGASDGERQYLWSAMKGDRVCSFEVAEHVGKQNINKFLQNFKACGRSGATYYLSTPNYDPKVGAANNHTYDSGDGRGVAVQEWDQQELIHHLEKHFKIEKMFGTFASMEDYKPLLTDWQKKMFNALKEYYDVNLVSNLMAPMFPRHSRNTLYVMKAK